MKTLIVTVAGTATRFNRDTETEVLKCLYYKERPEYSLLSQILNQSEDIDEYIIVGGYLYEQLETFIEDSRKILYKSTPGDFENTHYIKGNGAYYEALNHGMFNEPLSENTQAIL